ncbi:hypothetical protein [Nevskia ramosa]|uniref:hypothetical protein n=1 Tax=Nevskia ramosa TaxID=64002 RepID=UPI0003B48558|nr:hypothetical protein [Nevskia ramosa]
MLPIASGKRFPITLDESTWTAVDLLAARAGISWGQWCGAVISKTKETENWTAAVRKAAIDGLLLGEFMSDLSGRAQEVGVQERHSLMRGAALLGDAAFEQEMSKATVQGEFDCTSFRVIFGHDELGTDCVWIRNQLIGGMHFAFVSPIK